MTGSLAGAPIPPMLPPLSDEEAAPEARAVFDDIRAVRGTDTINNFWRVLANDPALLARTWETLKATMGAGALDPLTKELIYVAVSVAHSCEYCINSHTAAARAKGMTDEMLMELVAVVGMASETNRLVTALQVPVDEAFLAPRRNPRPAEAAVPAPAKKARRKPAARTAKTPPATKSGTARAARRAKKPG